MAIDQREALIEAIRKQVEKERAEKAAKLKKEQEAMMFSKGGAAKKKEDTGKQKFKTLSAEDLARIEEKKRKKRAEAMGLTLEEYDKNMGITPATEEPAEEEVDDTVGATEVLTSNQVGSGDKNEEGGLGGGLGGLF